MTDLALLGIEIDTSQVRTANRELDTLDKKGKQIESRFTSLGKSAQRLGRDWSLYVTAPIVAGGALAVKTAADYERLQVQLEVLVGSAERAERVFGRLTEFASTSPFELNEIVKANNIMLGFGLSTERTFSLLQTLGDVSAVSGAKLETLARITGEARAENKLLTRDLRQLVNNGVPIIGLLADSLGVAENKIFDLASAGEISFEVLVSALEKSTQQSGLFARGMEKLSQTLSGLWSNFVDAVDLARNRLGIIIGDTFNLKESLRLLIANIERATDWFEEMDGSQQKMIVTLFALLAALGPVITILGTLSVAIGAISPVMLGVVAVIGTGTALIIKNWDKVVEYFTSGDGYQVWQDLKSISKETLEFIKALWDIHGDSILSTVQTTFKLVLEVFELSISRFDVLMKKLNGNMDTELNIFEDNWLTTLDNIDGKLSGLLSRLGTGALKSFNIVDTEMERIEKRLNELGVEYKAPSIFGPEEIERARTLLAFAEELAEMSRSEEAAFLGLDLAKAEELAKILKEIAERGIVPDAEIMKDPFEDISYVIRPKVDIEVPKDEVLDEFEQLSIDIQSIFDDFKVDERIFPPGSIGDLRNRIAELKTEMDFENSAEGVQFYQQEIERLQKKIEELTGSTSTLQNVALSLRPAFEGFLSQGVVDLLRFKEETKLIRNEFGELEEQTFTLQDRFKELFQSLIDDLIRTTTQLLIVKPLMDALYGAIGLPVSGGAGSVTPSYHGNVFSGGDIQPFAKGGAFTNSVVSTPTLFNMGVMGEGGRSEAILPLERTPNGDLGVKSSANNVNIQVHNHAGVQVDIQKRETPSGMSIEAIITNKIREDFASGEMDNTMKAVYGLQRGGRR